MGRRKAKGEGGGSGGGVQSVTGLNTNNTDPANPIVGISVDGVTITGDGTSGDPLVATPSGGTPASPDTSIQWNNAGSFGGSADFTYDDTNKIMTLDTIQYRQDVQNPFSLSPNINLYISNNSITPSFGDGFGSEYDLAIGKNILYVSSDPENSPRYPGDCVVGINILENAESVFDTGGNVVLGINIMQGNQGYSNNIAIGSSIMTADSGGSEVFNNVAIGQSALQNCLGNQNIAIAGLGGMTQLTTGNDNISLSSALAALSTGNNNIGIGSGGLNLVDGNENIIVGTFSGDSLISGSNNIIIGNFADVNATGRNFCVVLGDYAKALLDNQFVVGGSSVAVTGEGITSMRIGVNPTDTNGLIQSDQTTGSNIAYNTSSPRLRVGGSGLPTNASALAEFNSTTQGLLLPRMTEAQRDAIASPVAGLIIYNTTTNLVNFYNGTLWVAL